MVEHPDSPATGAQMLEWLATPAYRERRTETILHMADTVGLDEARRIMDRLRFKEQAVYTLFENDEMPIEARVHLDAFLGTWITHVEDWQALAQAHEPPPPQPQVLAGPQGEPHVELGAHTLVLGEAGTLAGHDEGNFFSYTRYRQQ